MYAIESKGVVLFTKLLRTPVGMHLIYKLQIYAIKIKDNIFVIDNMQCTSFNAIRNKKTHPLK